MDLGNFILQRITIPEIKNHVWFLKNLPADLMDERTIGNQFDEPDQPLQSVDTIMQIIAEASIPAVGSQALNHYLTDSFDMMDDDMDDLDSESELDIDSSGEIVYAMWSKVQMTNSTLQLFQLMVALVDWHMKI